jgi:molecular chaperone GrpE
MTSGNGAMDQATKDRLIERLRTYLDGLDAADAPAADGVDDETSDLYSVFVEIAGLRNEARAQARLVKEAFDQFRGVFETLQSSHAALDRELNEARAGARDQARALLRPLLLDMIDVRDRLAAGLAASAPESAPRLWAFWRRAATAADPWREGMEMTLRRLDRALADRRVTPVVTIGRPFSPAVARAVATRDDPSVAEGVVIAEACAGFEWDGELLRVAEVIVAKRAEASNRPSGRNLQ